MSADYKQLEFELYGLLFKAKEILDKAGAGSYDIVRQLDGELSRIRTKKYNVAVVGEFRRGKSSLINALLGLKVLPSDATPTTATVNRITYGTAPRATIYYKDGTEKELESIEELPDYVTKLTAEREETAATVKEAVVEYPIVICQNHVDIIDTPGLSDDEAMTDVTVSLLQDVDAAIVAVSALAPYAETEKKFVAKLIANRAVTHILFVITFIDEIDEDEYDRVYEGIRDRISRMTMDEVMQQYGDDEEVVAKAHRILDSPVAFGVSSKKALKAFVSNNRKLLAESKFPEFKEELFTILTAGQSVNMVQKAVNMLEDSAAWVKEEKERRAGEREEKKNRLSSLKTEALGHAGSAILNIDRLLTEASKAATEASVPPENLKEEMKACFIRQLSEVRTPQNGAVALAIRNGAAEAQNIAAGWAGKVHERVTGCFKDAAGRYAEAERGIIEALTAEGVMTDDEAERCMRDIENAIIYFQAPEFRLNTAWMNGAIDLLAGEPMADISAMTDNAFYEYEKVLADLCRTLRAGLFRAVREASRQLTEKASAVDAMLSQTDNSEDSVMTSAERELEMLVIQGKNTIKDLS